MSGRTVDDLRLNKALCEKDVAYMGWFNCKSLAGKLSGGPEGVVSVLTLQNQAKLTRQLHRNRLQLKELNLQMLQIKDITLNRTLQRKRGLLPMRWTIHEGWLGCQTTGGRHAGSN